MKRISLLLAAYLLAAGPANSQEEDAWDVYMAAYREGPGSTLVNMSLEQVAPIKALPYLLITGVRFKDCSEDGLPTREAFEKLYPVSDSITALLHNSVRYRIAGTFTHQCKRLDYFYLSDTTGIRAKLTLLYQTSFVEHESFITLQKDDQWTQYSQFLFPNEETQEYMSNTKVILKLQEAGDGLVKERQIDHFFYFPTEKDREAFIKNTVTSYFKIEGMEKIDKSSLPYQVRISSVDKVDLESMNSTTLAFRRDAKKYKGKYDGWETFVVK